jgi:hypothetical protein
MFIAFLITVVVIVFLALTARKMIQFLEMLDQQVIFELAPIQSSHTE